ncbi:hypothetical protein ZIOFF_075775 [Zingiber officinale]|uniref:Uncharacterized protein n=1 Tax=Zingiber officinale TaxID=94328 RepID=A0A8J5BTD0_ZINOF|nr:hypothetical protein ZIOFF_075775 [Zingiber officinale]
MERRGRLWCVGGLHGSVAGNDIGFTSPMSFMVMYGAWAGPPWMRLVDSVSTTIMERRGLLWWGPHPIGLRRPGRQISPAAPGCTRQIQWPAGSARPHRAAQATHPAAGPLDLLGWTKLRKVDRRICPLARQRCAGYRSGGWAAGSARLDQAARRICPLADTGARDLASRSAAGTLLVHAMPEKEIREDDFLNMDTIMSHSQSCALIKGFSTVELGQYHSRALETENSIVSPEKSENHTLPLTKDVLGVVATLGKVHDDNLSRILSEYLGLENMMAVVCKTYEGVMALEKYNNDGMIERRYGLNGLGLSVARNIQARYLVYCIENLRQDLNFDFLFSFSRPYVGEFIPEDLQRRLALLKPRLANGETPPEFIGFAVNMTDLDRMHLAYITPNGLGLHAATTCISFLRVDAKLCSRDGCDPALNSALSVATLLDYLSPAVETTSSRCKDT